MSGNMFSRLTKGLHTVDVHFTPTGSSNSTTLQSTFAVGNCQ